MKKVSISNASGASLVKFQPLVQEILCRQAFFLSKFEFQSAIVTLVQEIVCTQAFFLKKKFQSDSVTLKMRS